MQTHQPRTSGSQRMTPAAHEARQVPKASTEEEALTRHLMEKICGTANLNHAYKRVKSNKGSAGVDGMQVDELRAWWIEHGHGKAVIESLLQGTYQPEAVRGVEIPKPGNKGVRLLGIPTVLDRVVQQSIRQVLEPIFDPGFSKSSYGFRPRRSAHQGLKQAQEYVREGYDIVVDIDLEKFFDRVNHDILMSRLAKQITDKRLLKIIRGFLEAGIMQRGVCVKRVEGTPQGGPLSPLLANILLDELDKELERRGHRFCRYADDCNIYVSSLRAGERVLQSVKRFLGERLKLKVNEAKSGCAPVDERQFLGYRLLRDGKLVVAARSMERVKDKIRALTRRSRGVSLASIIIDINKTLRGWFNYFQLTSWPSDMKQLDAWIRRKLRCYRLKQRKRAWSIAKFLTGLGVSKQNALSLAASGKGWWRLSKSISVHQAMSNAWFDEQGLINLAKQRAALNI
jgi:RNA-directed DNA polymerase